MSVRVTLTLPDILHAQLAGAATSRGLNVQQYIMFSLVESMPKQVTVKLSAQELQEQAAQEAKAQRIAEIEAKLAAGLAAGLTYGETAVALGPIPTSLGQVWFE